ncbi:hypothetical protein JWG39_09460 [Desulforhopalus vacuolatus]|uniref:hypothetical protein n=1 Tax=Desulforhopalus vacuolatus TaxID=40414 RepID=UPI001962B05B|nr:hypothetical protein [Desulforhopalus vacuolatus]MBM9520040.1 hypothetical protein [Desulforhopalus vacuolatus]
MKFIQNLFVDKFLCCGLILLILSNLLGGVLIKISPIYYNKHSAIALLSLTLVCVYGVRTLLWLLLGKKYQLSFIYPLLGVNYILSLFVGILFFHEPFIFQRLAGAVIILVGVSIITLSKYRDDTSMGKMK